MTAPDQSSESEPTRRRNWLALAIGIIVLQFSYFPYAAAFIPREGETGPVIDPGLVAIALALAPVVFIAIGFISRNPRTPMQVLKSMGWLLGLGLAFGLVSPALGAAAGFGVGIALTLNMPEIDDQFRRRLIGVAFALVYMLAMLLILTPAGVFAGAILPGLMVGFADEYGAWRESRTPGP